jgi:tRNA 2-thiouridine synthesizing protein E
MSAATLARDADGHLANRADWTEAVALEIAIEEGLEALNDRHWLVINYMRKLTKESGVDTKELYALFPKGPAKKAAKIAGLPKPKGCI